MSEEANDQVRYDRLLGGLWGLLYGSAFGEVRLRWFREHPKSGSIRARIPGASWSIEAAQILCLLFALQRRDLPLDGLAERAVDWARLGIYFPDSEYQFSQLEGPLTNPALFGATHQVLEDYHRNAIEQSALLFVIPLLWSPQKDCAELCRQILTLGKVAVRDDVYRATLVMTLLWASSLIEAPSNAWQHAADRMRSLAIDLHLANDSIDTVTNIPPGDSSHVKAHRMLYLLAYLRQVFAFTKSFDHAVDFAMPPEPGLRIPMMLTGAMTGLYYGMSNLPSEWISGLRGRELVRACLARQTPGLETRK